MEKSGEIVPASQEQPVYEVLGLAAAMFKVPSEDYRGRLPGVRFNARKTGYVQATNCIHIKPEHVSNRGVYAEEGTHFLRSIYVPKGDDVVHEFLGGLGRLAIGGGNITLDKQYVKVQEYAAEVEKTVLNGRLIRKKLEKATMMPLNSKQVELRREITRELEMENGIESVDSVYENDIRAELEESIIDLEIERIEMGILLLNENTYKIRAHEQAYKMAQNIYDAGLVGDFLARHPKLIRTSDSKVLRIARKYNRKVRGRKF